MRAKRLHPPSLFAATVLACAPAASATADRSGISWEALSQRGEWAGGIQDESGAVRNQSTTDVFTGALALRRVIDPTPPTSVPITTMHLSDGQVLVGGFAGFIDREGRDTVRWKHPALGLIDVPVDRVAWMQFDSSSQDTRGGDADTVVLRNGDRIEGFIDSWDSPLTIDVKGQRQEVELNRVAAIWLVSKATVRHDVRVWTADGSVLDGDTIDGVPGAAFVLSGVDLAVGGASLTLLAEDVLAIERHPNRLLPLAKLTALVGPSRAAGLPRAAVSTPKRLRESAPLGAATISIRGPQRQVYEVPQGFTIFCADVSIPASMAPWTDCTLVVRQGDTELARMPLSREVPHRTLRVPINAGLLEFDLEEGAGGPVGDTVLLERGLFVAPDSQS